MRKFKIALTVFAFVFAIAGAFASKRLFNSYTVGATIANCTTAQSLGRTCYNPGKGTQCTISSVAAWVDDTACEDKLFMQQP